MRMQRVGETTAAELGRRIDGLIGADLNAAQALAERTDQLADLFGDSLSKAFAEVKKVSYRSTWQLGLISKIRLLADSILGLPTQDVP